MEKAKQLLESISLLFILPRASRIPYRGAPLLDMIYKLCTCCGRKIPEGNICPCQKKRKAAGDRQYDRNQRDLKAKEFYRSSRWLAVRQRVLNMDRVDVYMYMTQGKVIPADTVHHITPLRDDWSRGLDVSNLMSLHHNTHSMIEREYASRGARSMANTLYILLAEFRERVKAGEV